MNKKIIADKCASNWTDKDCPNEPTCQEYHIGQFGDKIVFLFCDECYKNWKEFQTRNPLMDYSERIFERLEIASKK